MKRQQQSLERFTGSDGYKRINCAEAISQAYHKDIAPLTDIDLKHFKKCGYGKAPGKLCGAYYAAEFLLKKGLPQMLEDFQENFKKEAGSIICKQIRKKKLQSCKGCVATSARYLSKITRELEL